MNKMHCFDKFIFLKENLDDCQYYFVKILF